MKNKILISADALKEAMQFIDKGNIRLALGMICIQADSKGNIIFETTDGHRLHQNRFNPGAAVFPDTKGIISGVMDKPNFSVHLEGAERYDLIFRMEEMAAIARLRKLSSSPVTIKFTKNRILLILKDKSLIRYVAPINGIPEGLIGQTIGINIRYFMEALKCFWKGITITIPAENPALSPMVMKPFDGEYPIHVVMPMRF